LLSRWPIDRIELHRPEGPDFPVLAARICEPVWPNCLLILALHAPRPGPGGRRERQLAFVARLAGTAGDDRVVVVGDLNVTPFSPAFAALLGEGRLRDSLVGQGLQSSWLSRWLPFGLTLDHVLVGRGIEVLSRARGQQFGSDHSPIVIDIRVQ
jgi:endonuclease/exonuclease/phosphatase (EEP) superfamily protein YafD